MYSYFTEYLGMFGTDHPLFWIFGILLLVLQSLHVFWMSIILKMVYVMFTSDKVVEDLRSDDEEEMDEHGNVISSRENNTRAKPSASGGDKKIK